MEERAQRTTQEEVGDCWYLQRRASELAKRLAYNKLRIILPKRTEKEGSRYYRTASLVRDTGEGVDCIPEVRQTARVVYSERETTDHKPQTTYLYQRV